MIITDEFISHRRHEDSFFSKNSNLNFHFWDKGEVAEHSHEYFEIFVMTQGRVTHGYNGATAVIKQGTLCVVRPDDKHSFEPYENEPSEHFNVRITVELFQSLCALVSPTLYENILSAEKLIKCKLKKYELDYFLQLVRCPQFIFKNAQDESALSVVKVILTNFLLSLHHSLKVVSAYPKWFRSFLEELNTPQTFALPLSELYALSGYSQTRLNTYFKQFTGMTLVAYMTKLKISYACNLLQTTSYTVLQISLMASFNTLCHFNYVFKKTVGLTPTQYRQKFQQSVL